MHRRAGQLQLACGGRKEALVCSYLTKIPYVLSLVSVSQFSRSLPSTRWELRGVRGALNLENTNTRYVLSFLCHVSTVPNDLDFGFTVVRDGIN